MLKICLLTYFRSDADENFRLNYQKALLTFNLLLRNINDSIREGDGGRLIECYKMGMLYFKCYGHNKYALSILKLLLRIKIKPDDALQLIWERFVNTRGNKGRNISMDLHLEHLNNFLKELLKNLRSNLNEANANRVSKALNNIKSLVENTEKVYSINPLKSSGNHAKIHSNVQHLANEMIKENPFSEDQVMKHYASFPEFNQHLLSNIDSTKIIKWSKKNLNEMEILL